jgi:cupin 2 domain-containing protein
MNNLLTGVPTNLAEELVDVLAGNRHVRIERIVSTGHATPDGCWYDQDEHEWVAVLTGGATLLFEGDDGPIAMQPGDHVLIPAHRRHRVESTSPDEPTVWLAVFYKDAEPEATSSTKH